MTHSGYPEFDTWARGVTATADELPEDNLIRGTQFTMTDAMFINFQGGALYTLGEAEAKDLKDMLRVWGKARQIEQVLSLPLAGLDWEIKKPKGDKGQTRFLQDFFAAASNEGGMSTPLDLIIGQMTSALTYRKAYFEKVFDTDGDGGHIYSSVEFRPASTCDTLRNPATAKFLGFQQTPVTLQQQEKSKLLPIKIEPKYAYVYIHGPDRDPINGVSELEVPYWCYKTQEKIAFLFFSYLEQQSLPRTIVEANDIGIATSIARQVAGMKNSSVLPVANNAGAQAAGRQMVYTLDSSGRGSAEFMNAINWLEQTALDSVLAGFTGLASAAANGRGSNALADTMSNFFLKSRQKDVREMEYCLRQWLLADLVRYNFGPDAAVPKLKFAPLVEADFAVSMDLLNSMASRSAGALFPDSFVKEVILNVSRYLGLDVEKISSSLESAQQTALQQALAAGLDQQSAQAASMASVSSLGDKIVRQAAQTNPADQATLPATGA